MVNLSKANFLNFQRAERFGLAIILSILLAMFDIAFSLKLYIFSKVVKSQVDGQKLLQKKYIYQYWIYQEYKFMTAIWK